MSEIKGPFDVWKLHEEVMDIQRQMSELEKLEQSIKDANAMDEPTQGLFDKARDLLLDATNVGSLKCV